jgi:hypothetical protein
MRERDVYSDGRVKTTAFLPRAKGQDREGLSVSVLDPQYLDLHRAKYLHPEKATASLSVKAVREIGLDVVADPDPEDPRHALITGIPDRTLGDEENLHALRFAEQLAKRAVVFTFPAAP